MCSHISSYDVMNVFGKTMLCVSVSVTKTQRLFLRLKRLSVANIYCAAHFVSTAHPLLRVSCDFSIMRCEVN